MLYEIDDLDLHRRARQCFRLFLETGADPTVGDGIEEGSAFSWAFSRTYGGDTEIMKLFRNSAADYGLTIHSRDGLGQTPLLLACANWTYGSSEKVLPFLISERGANVTDADYNGRGCLHLCLQDWPPCFDFSSYLPWTLLEVAQKEASALIFLIQKGANVYAKDDKGRSVSHMVYSQSRFDTTGSYRRDLWDFVLIVCGYEPFEVRGHFPRHGEYVTGHLESWQNYTQENFRRI
ncbi:hypothetical protein QBC44DRAFT_361321 [Cladorrhinum sp. PSN332]|nr:hypothetical protein QBC44DRAFT_361321 [Cladorrhinum sp. PSN332]